MTNEDQNIAIAQLCGWPANRDGYHDDEIRSMPHYTSCLNAMHEAEKVLTFTLPDMPYDESQRTRYVNKLEEMRGNKGMVMATSAQRAEAFLKTLGKWKD